MNAQDERRERLVARRILKMLEPFPVADRWRILGAVALLLGHDRIALQMIAQYGELSR
jgi:hypothetical protein